LRHRMRAFGNPGRGDAQKVSDLGVSCNQHVFYASPDLAVVLGHFGAANRRQLPPSPHGSSRINTCSAANHALGVGVA
jgi:hypothetical protein